MIISKEAKIGALFFIAIAVFMVFAVAIGALPTVGRYKMTVYFDKVYGLQPGNDVWLSGTTFGTVDSISHEEIELPANQQLPEYSSISGKTKAQMVKVVFSLPRPVTLYSDYSINVVDKSAIAGRAIDIQPGTPTNPVYEGLVIGVSTGTIAAMEKRLSETLAQVTSKEGQEKLQLLYDKASDALTQTAETLKEARKALDMLTAENSNYRFVLEDPKFRDNLSSAMEEIKKTSANLSDITAKWNNPNSLVSRLSSDETLYPRIESLMKNLDDFSQTLNSGKGITRMFADETLYSDITQTAREARRISQTMEKLAGEVEQDPQIMILGRPSPNESVLAKQLRAPQPASGARPVHIDTRKLVPQD